MASAVEPFRLSNSKANTYRRCPKRYEFSYVHKLERKRKAVQLYRGDWLHQLLMCHYDGEDWRERQTALTHEFLKLFEEEREELGDMPAETRRIFTSYLRHYREEDKGWNIVDTELEEEVELPDGSMFTFIIDSLAEESDGGLWLWDHKTVKEFMPEDFMLIDSQLARYFWAAEKIGIGPVRGVMFNEVITKPPTLPKFLEKSGRLEMRKNLVCDAYTYMAEIKRLKLDPAPHKKFVQHLRGQSDRWFRRTPLPRDKHLTLTTMRELQMTASDMKRAERNGHFPRAPMKSCTWDCDFLDLCTTELMGGDFRSVASMSYRTKKKRGAKK